MCVCLLCVFCCRQMGAAALLTRIIWKTKMIVSLWYTVYIIPRPAPLQTTDYIGTKMQNGKYTKQQIYLSNSAAIFRFGHIRYRYELSMKQSLIFAKIISEKKNIKCVLHSNWKWFLSYTKITVALSTCTHTYIWRICCSALVLCNIPGEYTFADQMKRLLDKI